MMYAAAPPIQERQLYTPDNMLQLIATLPMIAADTYQSFDLGIESMRSHGYSVAIFIFMMIAIAVFVGIIWAFLSFTKGEKVKRGELVLFAMIILGVVAASIFAAVQLLEGVLF